MAPDELDIAPRSPSGIPLPASPVASGRQAKHKARPPPLDLSTSMLTAYSSLAPTSNIVPPESCATRASDNGVSTGSSLKCNNHYRQRHRQDLRPFLGTEKIKHLTPAAFASSTLPCVGVDTFARAAGHARQAEENDYFTQDSRSIDRHEYSPLLHDSLASASPIFNESSMSSPLMTPNQSFRLRPRESTTVADIITSEVNAPTNPRAPEPVAEGTLARPSWRRLPISYVHNLVQRMEHWIGDYVDSIVQWAMQRYGATEPWALTGHDSGRLHDHDHDNDLLFPIGSMATDWQEVDREDESPRGELRAVVVGDDAN